MCTSFVFNGERTIVGFNLDILGMEHRVNADASHVFIEIFDKENGWLPLFGVNRRGDFVAMPTCHPYDARSERTERTRLSVLEADIDLLLEKRTFSEIVTVAEDGALYSLPGVTFQMQLSDRSGNVLLHTPGQGCTVLTRPRCSVMTNFSPWKGLSETHPWMGADRYDVATKRLESAPDGFTVTDAFALLRDTSQTVCPTVVSLVYDADTHTAHWCENREYGTILTQKLSEVG